MGWMNWVVPAGLWAAAPFTGGATIPMAIGATAGSAQGELANRGKGGGKSDDNAEAPYLQQLQKSSDRLGQQGQQFSAMGADASIPALQHLTQLLSNNPAAAMEATRQERGRVLDQYDTARRAIANFGPRGGGTTSALAESQFSQAESLADITSNVRRGAALDLSQIGMQLSSLGLSAEQLASGNIETIIQAVLAREGINTERRGQNMALAGGAAEIAGQLLGMWLGREGGAWGPQSSGTGVVMS